MKLVTPLDQECTGAQVAACDRGCKASFIPIASRYFLASKAREGLAFLQVTRVTAHSSVSCAVFALYSASDSG